MNSQLLVVGVLCNGVAFFAVVLNDVNWRIHTGFTPLMLVPQKVLDRWGLEDRDPAAVSLFEWLASRISSGGAKPPVITLLAAPGYGKSRLLQSLGSLLLKGGELCMDSMSSAIHKVALEICSKILRINVSFNSLQQYGEREQMFVGVNGDVSLGLRVAHAVLSPSVNFQEWVTRLARVGDWTFEVVMSRVSLCGTASGFSQIVVAVDEVGYGGPQNARVAMHGSPARRAEEPSDRSRWLQNLLRAVGAVLEKAWGIGDASLMKTMVVISGTLFSSVLEAARPSGVTFDHIAVPQLSSDAVVSILDAVFPASDDFDAKASSGPSSGGGGGGGGGRGSGGIGDGDGGGGGCDGCDDGNSKIRFTWRTCFVLRHFAFSNPVPRVLEILVDEVVLNCAGVFNEDTMLAVLREKVRNKYAGLDVIRDDVELREALRVLILGTRAPDELRFEAWQTAGLLTNFNNEHRATSAPVLVELALETYLRRCPTSLIGRLAQGVFHLASHRTLNPRAFEEFCLLFTILREQLCVDNTGHVDPELLWPNCLHHVAKYPVPVLAEVIRAQRRYPETDDVVNGTVNPKIVSTNCLNCEGGLVDAIMSRHVRASGFLRLTHTSWTFHQMKSLQSGMTHAALNCALVEAEHVKFLRVVYKLRLNIDDTLFVVHSPNVWEGDACRSGRTYVIARDAGGDGRFALFYGQAMMASLAFGDSKSMVHVCVCALSCAFTIARCRSHGNLRQCGA